MKPPKIVSCAVSLAFTGIWLAGCSHVPPGGAEAVSLSFGIPGVFQVKKGISNVKVTGTKIAVGDADTHVQIALFVWDSAAKGVVLTNPPRKDDKP